MGDKNPKAINKKAKQVGKKNSASAAKPQTDTKAK